MPIKGLTYDAPISPSLIRFGKIRKGGPAPAGRPGPDLDHFRVTFEPRFEFLAKPFAELYTDKPRSLPAMLLGNEVDDVFETWFEEWSKTALVHRCDGEEQLHGLDPGSGRYKSHIPCVRGEGTDINDTNTFKCGCQMIGRLTVAIPALWEEAGVPGVFEMVTHSKLDIMRQLYRRLHTMHKLYGGLMRLPVTLARQEVQISYANAKSKSATGRTGRSVWLVTIEEDFKRMRDHSSFARLMGQPAQIADVVEPARKALPSNSYAQTRDANVHSYFADHVIKGIAFEEVQAFLTGVPADASKSAVIGKVIGYYASANNIDQEGIDEYIRRASLGDAAFEADIKAEVEKFFAPPKQVGGMLEPPSHYDV